MTAPQLEVQLPDGTICRANTIAELVQMRREMLAEQPQSNGVSKPAAKQSVTTTPGTKAPEDAQWDNVCEQLKSEKFTEEHKVLAVVNGSKKPVPTADVMRALGWKQHGQLGARIAGIGRICTKAGIPKDSLLIREGNQKKGFTFRPGAMLAKHELPPVPEGAR